MNETEMLKFVVFGEGGKIVAYCDTYRDAMLVFLGRLPDTALISEKYDEGDGTHMVYGITPSSRNEDRVIHCVIKRQLPE